MDSNRVQLLTVIDSPFVQVGFTGQVTVSEAAEALYVLSAGPDALKPALDGRRADFTVRALHFYEHHARGTTLQDMAVGIIQMIDEALAEGGEEEGTETEPEKSDRKIDDKKIADGSKSNSQRLADNFVAPTKSDAEILAAMPASLKKKLSKVHKKNKGKK